MRAYRCDMCHSVFLLSDGTLEPYDDGYEEAPGCFSYRPGALSEDEGKMAHKFDLCHDCAKKIERFISDNLEEVRKKVLE